jgi:DNA-binding NarL/FixJ family response regulator
MQMKENHSLNSVTVPGPSENLKPNNGNSTANERIGQLSPREMEVLQLITKGKLNKQMASELRISVKTIEKHRENLSNKLSIHGIARLTHFAIYTGIVPCSLQMAMS